jgi:pimeloyl-ACP methyl ester carboxylesterase
MKMLSPCLLAIAFCAGAHGGVGLAQQLPPTLPTSHSAHPEPRAGMESFQLPSHGALLNAFVYTAAGPGPHPAVLLLHGFPGNEKNLDLAQAIRRAGWDVLFFNYRGSWGSPGDFSFAHSIEDTAAAIAYLRTPANATRLRLDPGRIVLIGHSMGGFMAVEGAASDPSIAAIGLLSAADMTARVPQPLTPANQGAFLTQEAASLAHEGMAPLAGCTPDSLARELAIHAQQWRFLNRAAELASRPVLVVTSDDGLAPANDTFVARLRADGDTHVTLEHFDTDHAYSDERLELTAAVLHWLATLPIAPPSQP